MSNGAVKQGTGALVQCGTLRLDLGAYRLRCNDSSQPLTVTQVHLLRRLMESPGTVVSRGELADMLPYARGDQAALTAAVSRLRKALRQIGCDSRISRVKLRGYALCSERDVAGPQDRTPNLCGDTDTQPMR